MRAITWQATTLVSQAHWQVDHPQPELQAVCRRLDVAAEVGIFAPHAFWRGMLNFKCRVLMYSCTRLSCGTSHPSLSPRQHLPTPLLMEC